MKKKTYEKPQVEIREVKMANIICTSTPATFGINPDEGYEEEDW